MQTMNQALEQLVKDGKITAEQALKTSGSNNDLKLSLSGMVRQEGYEMAGKFHEMMDSGPIELDRDNSEN
jgi:Tfp pilus assembly ATPase PilU